MEADLVEVFSSIQGEGVDVGRTTLFVRFGGCDLRCAWCDSPHTWRPAPRCRIEEARGAGRFRERTNPVPLDDVVTAAHALGLDAHAMVSLTGGEPLLQPQAAEELARRLGAAGPEVLLETHGIHADALARVVDHVEVVSMDWKLASDVRRASDPARGPVEPFHEAHERFLEVARRAPRTVVKVVVTGTSGDEEIDEVARRVARTHPGATLLLQPVTPRGAVRERPTAARMLGLAERLAGRVRDVRVIPQTHPIWGAL